MNLFKVRIERKSVLRYILFRDSSLERICRMDSETPEDRLRMWVRELNKGYSTAVGDKTVNFEYFLERFEDRFFDVLQAVRILRGLELDAIHNRRWTSRFLLPRGPRLQLADVKEDFSVDRRFFGRGGEMIYLMLSRSSFAERIAKQIKKHFFDARDPLDEIAAELTPPSVPDSDTRSGGEIGYLPLKRHRAYDRMAEDWLYILELKLLPGAQKLDPLFRLTALNLVCYFIERAHEVSGTSALDPIPLDLTGGKRSDLRDLSRSYLKRHRQLIEDAVEAYIASSLSRSPKWKQAREHPVLTQRSKLACQAIREVFLTRRSTTDVIPKEPLVWLNEFVMSAKRRSRNNISTLIEPLGKQSGFVLSRQRVGPWFAGTDEFLEALVLARVQEPITISEFVDDLYLRYRIVVGPREAARAFERAPCDISSFEDNFKAFERRLTGLGYVTRLSDDCAFVFNPYTSESNLQ